MCSLGEKAGKAYYSRKRFEDAERDRLCLTTGTAASQFFSFPFSLYFSWKERKNNNQKQCKWQKMTDT